MDTGGIGAIDKQSIYFSLRTCCLGNKMLRFNVQRTNQTLNLSDALNSWVCAYSNPCSAKIGTMEKGLGENQHLSQRLWSKKRAFKQQQHGIN